MKLKAAIGADHGCFILKNESATRLHETCEILNLRASTFEPSAELVKTFLNATFSGETRCRRSLKKILTIEEQVLEADRSGGKGGSK